MSKRRIFGTMAAIGGFTAAIALLAGVPSAKADELSDLRVNNDLLQQKLDQLSQLGPGVNVGPSRLYSSDVQANPAAATGGSFPRSFLIPGTDTSIRVGGQMTEIFDYWFQGGPPNGSPQSTTVGDNGQVQSIGVGTTANPKGSNIFQQSARESKLSVETRTPTPYGEARTYMEFDWAGSSALVPGGTDPTSVSDNLLPRLRFAYGTLGGWLAGQANSNFEDPDANAETLDFGGNVGEPGVVRLPQLRYTMPLNWGFGGALSLSAETPETDVLTTAGIVASDCGAGCAATPGGVGLPAGALATNPTKASAPDLTAALYIPEPWGHIDISGVLRPGMELTDGFFLSRNFVGGGGHIGFDFKPGWFTPKDDITFHFTAGDGIGRYLNSSTNFAIETNYGNAGAYGAAGVAPTAAGAAGVLAKLTTEWGSEIGYQHWWSDNLRSTFSYGINRHDINAVDAGCVGALTEASCGANKELQTAHANLIWNPVSFVTIGIEYMYGRRTVVAVPVAPNSNNEQALIGKFAVAF